MFIYPAPRGRYQHTNQGYAVIDLETTGFDATGRDRIVEIAIVRVDPSGRELGVFETLIDPQRPVGAGAVHGIDDAMVRGAPTFPEIAPSILAWLQGVVVVAHHAPFEDAFLSAEYSRAGWSLPPLPAIDTLPIAQACVPTPDHKLMTVCDWAGITIDRPHTATGDARATAAMLPTLLERAGRFPPWRARLPELGGSLCGRYRPRDALLPTLGSSRRRRTTLESSRTG